MGTQGAGEPVGAVCPGCGGTEVRTVGQARDGGGAMRAGLNARLAPGPDKTGDGCMHFVEGMVLTGIGVAVAYTGAQEDKPLYALGGAALALVFLVGTFVVVRGDGREKAAAGIGSPRAERLWLPAHYCSGCASVFCPGDTPWRGVCPGDTPWRGVLTPEQFKKLVWTEAGYADQLPAGDKARDAEVPAGVWE